MSGKINQTFNPVRMKGGESVPVEKFNALVSQLNNMKKDIERALSQTALTTLITSVIASGSGGGSSSTGSTVNTVTKSVTGGTTYNEVFDAPSLLLSLPIVYVTDGSGLMATSFPPLTSLTANGFTIIPIEDGTLIYSYVNL